VEGIEKDKSGLALFVPLFKGFRIQPVSTKNGTTHTRAKGRGSLRRWFLIRSCRALVRWSWFYYDA